MSSSSSQLEQFPTKLIPGDYGLPFFGPVKDRLDYFYNQGKDKFFSIRVQKYNSTVIRTNMSPGPFIADNPRVVALLDAVSFPVLFDMSKVEKRNVLDGTYFPSFSFFGGYRVCAFLDTSEPNHSSLKSFYFSVLASKHDDFIPLFRSCLSECFIKVDDEMASRNKARLNPFIDQLCFNFMFRLFCNNKDPSDTKLGSKGPGIIDTWLALQLAPLASIGLPKFLKYIEDFLLHTFRLPFFLVKSSYNEVYDALHEHAGPVLDKAESFGIEREEACHNLVFLVGFNAYGGLKAWFSTLLSRIGLAGEKLHRQLADEIRTIVKNEGGVTFQALDKMTLSKSVVYESLRIDPPVPYQYGKAREDLVVHSHDAAFEIKKGEMIFGYQPFATKDPKIFDDPEEFVGDRFVGEGEMLLKYVYWSNGHETEDPKVENKQCPGKQLVVLLGRLLLVEFFLRYDTFTVESKPLPGLGASVTITSLTKATST